MKKNFLDSDVDYWQVSKTIKNLYLSDGSVNSLLDFERVIDEVDIYAFKNWDIGELVQGPLYSNVHIYVVGRLYA